MQKCAAQVTICSGKKAQETQFKRSNRPTIKYKKKNHVYMGEDQKCQVPISANQNCKAENIKGPVKPKKVSKNKNCSNNNIVNIQLQRPSLNQENFKKPVTKPNSSLCRDRNCQSTRCFKKATKDSYKNSTEKPRCGDDKNCQSSQFMGPEKPTNAMQIKYPAANTRKMQSQRK